MRSMLMFIVVATGCMKAGGEHCDRDWWCEGSLAMRCEEICDGDKLETCMKYVQPIADCDAASTELGVPKMCAVAQVTVNGDAQAVCLDTPIEPCPMVGAVSCSTINTKHQRVCVGSQGASSWDTRPFCTGAQHCQESGTGGISCVN